MSKAIERLLEVIPLPLIAGAVGCVAVAWLVRLLRRQTDWADTLHDGLFGILCASIILSVIIYYGFSLSRFFFPPTFDAAERGIYVARFDNDERGFAQANVYEMLTVGLSKTVAFRDVRIRRIDRAFADPAQAQALCQSTNAVLCIWGTLVPPQLLYLKISNARGGGNAVRLFPDYLKLDDLVGIVAQTLDGASRSEATPSRIDTLESRIRELEASQRRIMAWLEGATSTGERAGKPGTTPSPPDDHIDFITRERGRWRRALVVGIGAYETSALPRLAFAARDAAAVAQQFRRLWPDKSEATVLIDAGATRASIIDAMERIRGVAGQDDQIWVYFTGHAVSHNGTATFLPYDGRPDQLLSTGIDLQAVFEWLSRISAAQGAFFVDTCYSGAFRGSFPKGIAVDRLSPLLLSRFGRSMGRVVFTATGPDELAFESPSLGGGVFTRALLEGLGGKGDPAGVGAVVATELFSYIQNTVIRESRRAGFRQNPSYWSTVTDGDLILALTTRLAEREGK